MTKSISVLLSMLLLISAAQVEAKLQIISNNELKQHSEKRGAEKAPAKKEIANKSEQRTESFFGQVNPVLLITAFVTIVGCQIFYWYFKSKPKNNSKAPENQGGNPYESGQDEDQHGGDPSSSSQAAPVSTSSATQVSSESLTPGVVHLSHGDAAMGAELDRGAQQVIAASLSSSSNSHTFVREEEDDDDDDASPSSSSSSSCNTVGIEEELKKNPSIYSQNEYTICIEKLIDFAKNIMMNKAPKDK